MKRSITISISLIIISVSFLLSSGCSKNNDAESASPLRVPTVTTGEVTDISLGTATCGGNVTSQGSSAVTERGVCWSTTQQPTTAGSHSSDGTGTGDFSSIISGIDQTGTYYVRAYATNSSGTAYGHQVSFEPLSAPMFLMSFIPDPNDSSLVIFQFKCTTNDIRITRLMINDPLDIINDSLDLQQILILQNTIYALNYSYPGTPGKWTFTFTGNLVSDSTAFVSTAYLTLTK
jgi:hypothetical protein